MTGLPVIQTNRLSKSWGRVDAVRDLTLSVGANRILTVEQMIRFTSAFYPDWRADVARTLLKKYDLPPDRKVKSLSKGMRSKLALLLALSRKPKLLILDEPSEGLDPVGVEQFLESLSTQCSDGTSVFFSSHQIEEVERIADHVCILDRGRLLLDASLDDIRGSYRQIDLVFPFEPKDLEIQVAGVESVSDARPSDECLRQRKHG